MPFGDLPSCAQSYLPTHGSNVDDKARFEDENNNVGGGGWTGGRGKRKRALGIPVFAEGGAIPVFPDGGGQGANSENDDAFCLDGAHSAFGTCNLATLDLLVADTHS